MRGLRESVGGGVWAGLSNSHSFSVPYSLSNNQLGREDTKVLMGALEGKCWLKRLK